MQTSSLSPLIQGQIVPLGPQGGQQVAVFWGYRHAELGQTEWVVHACLYGAACRGGDKRRQAAGGDLPFVLLF